MQGSGGVARQGCPDPGIHVQRSPDRLVIAGSVDIGQLTGLSRIGPAEPAGKDVIPGKDRYGVADIPGGPEETLLLEIVPDSLAVEVPATTTGQGIPAASARTAST